MMGLFVIGLSAWLLMGMLAGYMDGWTFSVWSYFREVGALLLIVTIGVSGIAFGISLI